MSIFVEFEHLWRIRSKMMAVSLMPEGLTAGLSKEELRDLMTYLLTEGPAATSGQP